MVTIFKNMANLITGKSFIIFIVILYSPKKMVTIIALYVHIMPPSLLILSIAKMQSSMI